MTERNVHRKVRRNVCKKECRKRKKDTMRKAVSGWTACALLVSLVFLCTACGQSGQEDGSAAADIGSVLQEEAGDPVELKIMYFFDLNTPGTHYHDLWEELAAEKGYKLKITPCSTEQIKDKLRTALACNELPDIFVVWGGGYPNFLFDANACLPMQDYLEASAYKFQDIYVVPYKDGNNYIIPCLVEAYAVTYCNQNLMKQMGLEMPQTWEELVELVEQVNAYNERHRTNFAAIELGDKDNWLAELLYDMIVNRIDPYAFDKLQSGEYQFDETPVFADAADKLAQLVDMGAFPEDFIDTGEVEAIENFVHGEAVLFPHQSTIVNYLIDNMGAEAFTLESFPCCSSEFDPDYAAYMMDINHSLTPGFCISANTEHPEEAAKLCLEFAERVNEINVTQYGYLNMEKNSKLQEPGHLAAPAVQLQEMVSGAKKQTAFWYALMEKEEGDDWRRLIKKYLTKAVTKEEFLQEGRRIFGGGE